MREIWFTTTKAGTRRAWHFNGRALPMRLAEAELMIATGKAVEVDAPKAGR